MILISDFSLAIAPAIVVELDRLLQDVDDPHSVPNVDYLIPLSLFFSVLGDINGPTNKVVGQLPSCQEGEAGAVPGIHGRSAIHQRLHLIFNLDFYEPQTMGTVIFLPSLSLYGWRINSFHLCRSLAKAPPDL